MIEGDNLVLLRGGDGSPGGKLWMQFHAEYTPLSVVRLGPNTRENNQCPEVLCGRKNGRTYCVVVNDAMLIGDGRVYKF